MNIKKVKYPEKKSAYLLIAPAYIIFVTFILVPIAWSIFMSLTDYDFRTSHFVGFANYINIFKDEIFIKSLLNTIEYGVYTIVPSMVIGLLFAVFLNEKVPGRGFFRTIFYMPNIFSMVAVSMVWLYLFDTNAGILNKILMDTGHNPVYWLSDPHIAMFSISLTSIWQTTGYNMVLFLSGLQSIPKFLYEAAEIDGETKWGQFWKITLPLLAPTTFFVFIISCIRAFQVFGQVLIMTSGGPMNSTTTIAHQIYRNGFEYYKMGYASAEAVILLLIILAITLINYRYGKGEENDLA